MAVTRSNCGLGGELVVVVGELVVVDGGVVVLDGGVVVVVVLLVVGGAVVVVGLVVGVVDWAIAVAAASALARITTEIDVPIATKPRRPPTHTILTAYRPDVKYSSAPLAWAGPAPAQLSGGPAS